MGNSPKLVLRLHLNPADRRALASFEIDFFLGDHYGSELFMECDCPAPQ